tara:strand:+ start:8333 stop:8878 length:546 start_codon:yes stop_codon:yes gene_type:complete
MEVTPKRLADLEVMLDAKRTADVSGIDQKTIFSFKTKPLDRDTIDLVLRGLDRDIPHLFFTEDTETEIQLWKSIKLAFGLRCSMTFIGSMLVADTDPNSGEEFKRVKPTPFDFDAFLGDMTITKSIRGDEDVFVAKFSVEKQYESVLDGEVAYFLRRRQEGAIQYYNLEIDLREESNEDED